METELAALAASGATALVGLLVSDAYERAKGRLGRFLGRGAPDTAAEDEVRAAREELSAGGAGTPALVETRLRHRLEGVFQDDPGAARELARLLSEVAPETSRTFVSLVGGGVYHGPVFQGSAIHGGITFQVAAPPPSAPGLPSPRPDQVPTVTVPFSNRTAELALLDDTLAPRAEGSAAVAVDVLDGLPGVGKTTMAWHWAQRARDRFPDGQLYVDFAALRDRCTPVTGPGADVSEALAMCLRSLPGGGAGIPDSLAERTNLYRSRTAELRILLVLDDVNQAAQVRALIPKGPGSVVLATSQGRLGELSLGGARLISVGPLDAHGGLALLSDRCRPGAVEDEPEAARRLVELCGGLPVALQIVAARLAADDGTTMAELAAELDDETGRMAGLTLDEEGPSVSAVLDSAYRLLPPDAARLYRLLGWLPFGVFDLGVAAVASHTDPPGARRTVRALARASLVESIGGGRYRMHDLVRLHARERALAQEPEGEQTALIRRVGTHYLALTALADRALRKERLRVADLTDLLSEADDPFATPGGPPPLAWLDTEHLAVLAVLRAAAHHGLHTLTWQLSESFAVLFLYHRYLGTWREALELGARAAASAASAAGTAGEFAEASAGEARLRSLLSRPLLDLGEDERARTELDRAAALAEVTDRLDLRASVQEFLGRYWDRHDASRAVEAYRRSLDLNERAGETRGAALATFFLGRALDARGDHEEALVLLRRAHRDLMNRAEPDRRMAARVQAAIGVTHGHLGAFEDAIRELREAITVLGAEAPGMQYEAQAQEDLAGIAQRAGGPAELVRGSLERAAEIYESFGDRRAEEVRRRLAELGG
ncbi:ATP-binding protein [Streptomyces sp. NPDC059477]|uniref:ATP-binding protein n=1 Tax=Streptomyces sp. NPDC059477 TaxID=3346847 RepID=UPI00368CEA66